MGWYGTQAFLLYRLKDLKEEKLKPKGLSKFQIFFSVKTIENMSNMYVKNRTKNVKLKLKTSKAYTYLPLTGPKKPDVPKGCTKRILALYFNTWIY